MTRFRRARAFTLAVALLPLTHIGQIALASGGNNDVQTVAVHRQSCAASSTGATVGAARLSLDDQGGEAVNPNGIEIRSALTSGMPRSTYSVLVIDSACQVLVRGGTLTTDDSGRGDLDFHVLGSAVPPGTTVRVQLVDPATATVPGTGPFVDVLTSDAVSAP